MRRCPECGKPFHKTPSGVLCQDHGRLLDPRYRDIMKGVREAASDRPRVAPGRTAYIATGGATRHQVWSVLNAVHSENPLVHLFSRDCKSGRHAMAWAYNRFIPFSFVEHWYSCRPNTVIAMPDIPEGLRREILRSGLPVTWVADQEKPLPVQKTFF